MIPGMNKKQMKQMERQMKKMGMKKDIEMVANSANVSEDEARQALEECKGDLAEAIMKLNQ